MATFAEQLQAAKKKYFQRELDIFYRVVDLVFESVVLGSTVTGSPGQPVDTGNLKSSWTKTYVSKTLALIQATGVAKDGTPVGYAIHVELNVRGIHFRVGGAHSVSITAQNFQKLVEQATREIVGSDA